MMVLTSDYRLGEEAIGDLPSLLFHSMLRYGDNTFMINSETGSRYSFRDTFDHCREIGQSLYHRHGIRKGDVILIFSANCPEYVLFVLGAISIGAIVTTANPLFTVGELRYHLQESKAKLVLTSLNQCRTVRDAKKGCVNVQDVIVFGEASGFIPFETLLNSTGGNFPEVTFDPENDVIFMPYSSGTVGRAKGVLLTHSNMLNNNKQLSSPGIELFGTARSDTIMVYVPLYHIYGIMLVVAAILAGQIAVIVPKYELLKFIDIIKKYKVTLVPVVPPTIVQLTKNENVQARDFDSVRSFFYGAAPLSPELEQEFSRKFARQELRQGYGLTETSPLLTMTPKGVPLRLGSVGKVAPVTELRFVDAETGKEVGTNERGEIWARGPQVMKGYFNEPEQTRRSIDKDGWFHTGDVGYHDKDGYVYIVDRLKELIKYKGFQVAPAELEGLLLSHPSVADCGVIGVPDLEAGELPRAYVVLKANGRRDEASITKFVAEHVAPHKRLRGGVRFVETIPKSPSGKILRRVLRARVKREQKVPAKL